MQTHTTTVRVRYEETDRMGVVYYGNYFVWFEVARTEFFRSMGISYRELEEKEGLRLMVVEASARYKSPVTYDDLLGVETSVGNVKNTSLSFSYKIYRGKALIATGETSHVFTNDRGKPVKIPDRIKETLTL